MSRVLFSTAGALGLTAMFLAVGCQEQPSAPRKVDLGTISAALLHDNQTGIAGEALAQPIQVEVRDAANSLVPSVTVEWSVTSPQDHGASLYVSHSSTGASGPELGIASNVWTLGTDASETQTVHVKAVLPSGEALDLGDFSAKAIAGPPTQISIVDGDNQQALHGTAVANPLRVLLKDKNDNPVPGIQIAFTVSTGGGNLSGLVTQTAFTGINDGIASMTNWVLGGSPCKNTLVATATAFPGIGSAVIFTAAARDCWSVQAGVARALLGVGEANGYLYAVGGYAGSTVTGLTSTFVPTINTWLPQPSMSPREGVGVAVVGNRLYAVGGCATRQVGSFCPAPLATVQAFDLIQNTWTTSVLAPMPTARANLALVAFQGKLYAIGGTTIFGVTSAVEAYDPASNTWTPQAGTPGALAPIPTPRGMLAADSIYDRIYAVGGVDGTNLTQNVVEAYDPAHDSWTPAAQMPTARLQLAVVRAGNLLYALGGSTANGFGLTLQESGAVEAYDPVHDAWTAKAGTPGALAALPGPRFALAAGSVEGIVYAVGGVNSAGAFFTTYAYNP